MSELYASVASCKLPINDSFLSISLRNKTFNGVPEHVYIGDSERNALSLQYAKAYLISLKYANGLRNGANSDTHRCKQLTEHGEERCIKLREVAGFSAVRTIFQIVGPRKILHCLLGK